MPPSIHPVSPELITPYLKILKKKHLRPILAYAHLSRSCVTQQIARVNVSSWQMMHANRYNLEITINDFREHSPYNHPWSLRGCHPTVGHISVSAFGRSASPRSEFPARNPDHPTPWEISSWEYHQEIMSKL